MRRIGTMSIKEILHHRHGLGLTRAQTATAVGVSTGTVSHILERTAAGLSWPLPDGLDDEAPRSRRQVRRNPQMPSSLLETAGLSRQNEHGLLNSPVEGYASTPLRVAEEEVTRR